MKKEIEKDDSLDLMERMGLIKKDLVMEEYYNILSNENKPIAINEATLNNLLFKHGDNGFIIVSANRSDIEPQENNKNTRELISILKNSRYSYLPVYGGYKGTDKLTDKYEPSFFITNFDKSGNKVGDFNQLKAFGLDLCKKYNQDSVLVKEPGNVAPYYMAQNGQRLQEPNLTSDVKINRGNEEYFTSLKKSKANTQQGNKRFTYGLQEEEEEYKYLINPPACTLNEHMRRFSNNEIQFDYGKSKEIFKKLNENNEYII